MLPIQINSSKIGFARPAINRNREIHAIPADYTNILEKAKIAHSPEAVQDAEFTEIKTGDPLQHIDIYV